MALMAAGDARADAAGRQVMGPLCPHGCFKRKPMEWVDDCWYCPKCGAEFYPDDAPADPHECTADLHGTCPDCGLTLDPECQHVWMGGTNEPTICALCGGSPPASDGEVERLRNALIHVTAVDDIGRAKAIAKAALKAPPAARREP